MQKTKQELFNEREMKLSGFHIGTAPSDKIKIVCVEYDDLTGLAKWALPGGIITSNRVKAWSAYEKLTKLVS